MFRAISILKNYILTADPYTGDGMKIHVGTQFRVNLANAKSWPMWHPNGTSNCSGSDAYNFVI